MGLAEVGTAENAFVIRTGFAKINGCMCASHEMLRDDICSANEWPKEVFTQKIR